MARINNGGINGKKVTTPTNSAASGKWNLSEQNIYKQSSDWPGAAWTSPQELQNNGQPAGTYLIKSPSMNTAISMYYEPNYFDSKPWVRVFSSPYTSTATVNLLGNSIDWTGILVQRTSLDIRHTAYFSASRLYNLDSSATTSSSGTRTGYRVFLGEAGGHGIYNTSQSPCSWGDSNGAVGAGYNGTCGTFPNNLVWGTGQNGSPFYTNLSGTWEHWIYWT